MHIKKEKLDMRVYCIAAVAACLADAASAVSAAAAEGTAAGAAAAGAGEAAAAGAAPSGGEAAGTGEASAAAAAAAASSCCSGDCCTIQLEETSTNILYSLPSRCAIVGSEEHHQIMQRNRVYAELQAAIQSVPGRFKVSHTQTLNPQQKLKAVETDNNASVAAAVEASPANIHDALAEKPTSL